MERWRAPFVVRVKALVYAALTVTVALVFLPHWLGIPVAALLGLENLGVALLGLAVVLDPAAGRVVVRRGLLRRRVRLADITGVLVEKEKLSLARAKGGEFSAIMWRKGALDALLRVPVVASDAGHAIAKAVAAAQAASPGAADPAMAGPAGPAGTGRTPGRTRGRLAAALICFAGAVEIAAALLIRVHWHNPAMTVLGALIALALGISGLLTLLTGFWIALTGLSPLESLGFEA